MGKHRKKTSREHKAAVELASKRRELSKLLKREGFEGVPLDKKIREEAKPEVKETGKEELSQTKEEREKVRKQKLEERRERATKLMRKTSKGQPVMKFLVGDLLNKLSKSA